MTEDEKKKLKKLLEINEDDFVIIYTAEISKKGQKLLIKSIKKVVEDNNKVKLLLVGNDSLHGKCQKLVKRLNLEKNVLFLGYRIVFPSC